MPKKTLPKTKTKTVKVEKRASTRRFSNSRKAAVGGRGPKPKPASKK